MGFLMRDFFRPVFSDDLRPVFQLTLYGRFLGNLILTGNGWEMQGGYLQSSLPGSLGTISVRPMRKHL
jgi:hypothetical protein